MSSGFPVDPIPPAPRRKAAALRYDFEKDNVPRVVAKGQGEMADRIIALAQEHGITIHEDPDLIDMLTKLDVDQLIPEKLFVAVAEVMAYVYRINNRADEVKKFRG
ncbi:MAG: EscU/YscU/HrcU family type III secretion system export apparatus switch protein [Planctomycetota bacterium]